jgi:hypothetical protein
LAAPGVRNVFAFTQSGYSVSEHGGSAMVTVARSQSAGTGSVNYSTTDGGAHAGSQYVASAGTLSFASGQSEARFSVPVIDEHAVGGTKTLTLSLSGPVGGSASLGSPASAALTILDDDTPIVAAPSVTNATESHSRWRRGNHLATFTTNHPLPVGTTFSFALNEPATVKFAFTQKLGGRKVKGKCVAQTRKSRPKPACKRIVTRGTLTFAGHAGTNKVFFQGPISTRKKLQPGRYTLVITATDSARRHSNTKSLSFTIVN